MDHVKLIGRERNNLETVEWNEGMECYHWKNEIGDSLWMELKALNNRGWSFESWAVGSGGNKYFFSRGQYYNELE